MLVGVDSLLAANKITQVMLLRSMHETKKEVLYTSLFDNETTSKRVRKPRSRPALLTHLVPSHPLGHPFGVSAIAAPYPQ